MTRQIATETGTEFGGWLRVQPEIDSSPRGAALSIQNLDYIVHQYRDNKVMLIEEKRYGADRGCYIAPAQKDTHGVIHQLLELSSGQQVKTMRGIRSATYYGYHRLVFSHTTPDDSDWMTWDGEKISRQELINILRFEDIRAGPAAVRTQ